MAGAGRNRKNDAMRKIAVREFFFNDGRLLDIFIAGIDTMLIIIILILITCETFFISSLERSP
ncbi:MAG: hypothetical protein ACTSP4_12275 [Candidatus Hodarchaeales archaeon]